MNNERLPSQAQIVVVGGGAVGSNVAYQLTKLGCRDVVLLERSKLASGTTWHSSALVRQLRSTENLTRLIQYSTQLYAGLGSETGQATGWLQTGSLSIATNPDRLIHLRRQASLAKAFGIDVHEVSAAEAKRLWPLMNVDDVTGAVFSPSDGRVNPSDLCAALIKGAKANGVRVFEDTPVIGVDLLNGRVAAVQTKNGSIICETVVDCAGLWGRQVAAMAGVAAPLYACEHFAAYTEPIEGVEGHLPTLGNHDGYLYLRDEVGGLLVGCFEPMGKPLDLSDLPPDFSFGLLKEDWEHFEPMMLNAIHRIPALATAGIKKLLNGPESFTLDGQFLLGEAPEVRGFFLACGMNSVGIATGGGVGRALAEWIINGEPTMDLWPVDIRRFSRIQDNTRSLRERAPETLGLHYAIAYPGREHQTSRNLRLSPLHHRLAAQGAHFDTIMGWERASWFGVDSVESSTTLTFGKPGWFSQVAAEHRAARETVALFDMSSMGKLIVQGRDAEKLLQRLCANDIAVEPGRVIYTGMLNHHGGYESDLTVMRLGEDSFMLITGTIQPVRDRNWIQRHIEPDEIVTVLDVTSNYAVLSVMGPQARALMRCVSSQDFSNVAFPYFTHQQIELGYAVARASRVSYVGELGWELLVPAECALPVYDQLCAAGAKLGLRNGGSNAYSSLRIEKGFRAWGKDLGPDYTPLEAGLSFAVKWDKPASFIGREALLRLRESRMARRFVGLTLQDPEVLPLGGEPIIHQGQIVGLTTSGAFGHTIGRGIALGYVRTEGQNVHDIIGAGGFEIEIACQRYSAEVSLRAAYDPKGERMKADG